MSVYEMNQRFRGIADAPYYIADSQAAIPYSFVIVVY